MDVPFLPGVCCLLCIFVSFTAVLRCGESFCGESHPSSEKQLSSQLPAVGLFGFVFVFGFFAMFIKIGHYWANTDFNLVIVHGKHRDDH